MESNSGYQRALERISIEGQWLKATMWASLVWGELTRQEMNRFQVVERSEALPKEGSFLFISDPSLGWTIKSPSRFGAANIASPQPSRTISKQLGIIPAFPSSPFGLAQFQFLMPAHLAACSLHNVKMQQTLPFSLQQRSN